MYYTIFIFSALILLSCKSGFVKNDEGAIVSAKKSRRQWALVGQFVTESSLRKFVGRYFPAKDVGKALCAACFESRWGQGTYNYGNKNKTKDIGLFQINSVNWKKCKASESSLTNMENNVICAAKIYRAAGNKFSPWYAYSNNKAKCQSYQGGIITKIEKGTKWQFCPYVGLKRAKLLETEDAKVDGIPVNMYEDDPDNAYDQYDDFTDVEYIDVLEGEANTLEQVDLVMDENQTIPLYDENATLLDSYEANLPRTADGEVIYINNEVLAD